MNSTILVITEVIIFNLLKVMQARNGKGSIAYVTILGVRLQTFNKTEINYHYNKLYNLLLLSLLWLRIYNDNKTCLSLMCTHISTKRDC